MQPQLNLTVWRQLHKSRFLNFFYFEWSNLDFILNGSSVFQKAKTQKQQWGKKSMLHSWKMPIDTTTRSQVQFQCWAIGWQLECRGNCFQTEYPLALFADNYHPAACPPCLGLGSLAQGEGLSFILRFVRFTSFGFLLVQLPGLWVHFSCVFLLLMSFCWPGKWVSVLVTT